jgi:hypothetical protein
MQSAARGGYLGRA